MGYDLNPILAFKLILNTLYKYIILLRLLFYNKRRYKLLLNITSVKFVTIACHFGFGQDNSDLLVLSDSKLSQDIISLRQALLHYMSHCVFQYSILTIVINVV